MVGTPLRGLHRRYVGVDQDRLDPLFSKGLQSLTAGVVELSRFADFQRARSEHQHFLDVALLYHRFIYCVLLFLPLFFLSVSLCSLSLP